MWGGMDITLFELHLDDASFDATSNLPMLGSGDGGRMTSSSTGSGSKSGGGRLGRIVLGLVVFGIAAAAVKSMTGGDQMEDLVALDEEIEA